MALNKEMHPRNPYKGKPPDFKALALEFAEFRKYCSISSCGKVRLNFQEDAAVRELAKTLLKKDFALDVELPAGQLVPRIPQRINYILIIEDLLRINGLASDVIGIDIGTGASCVFPLLGARLCNWRFVATDADEHSVVAAHSNVSRNQLSDRICVAHVDENAKSLLLDVLSSFNETKFAFCMCNPPFYNEDESENKFTPVPEIGQNIYSNQTMNVRKPAPHSATMATNRELSVKGGEVEFTNRLIDDSIILRDRIAIYTTMLGHKHSVAKLRRRLERLVDVKSSVSTLNQGRTMRWILSWTFVSNIILDPPTSRIFLLCPKPGLVRLKEQMKQLEAQIYPENENCILFECRRVTWVNHRARRRAEARLWQPPNKKIRMQSIDASSQASMGVGDGRDSFCNAGNFVAVEREVLEDGRRCHVACQAYFPVSPGSAATQCLRFRVLSTSSSPEVDQLDFELLAGTKNSLHQLIQYLRNVFNDVGK